MALILFDVDGTLLSGISSERRFAGYLRRHGMLGRQQYLRFAWFCVRYAPRFGRHVLQKNKAWLSGLQRERIERSAQSFVDECLPAAYYRPAIRQLEMHLARGDDVILLTGMPEFLAAPLARALKVSTVLATECSHDGSAYLAQPPSSHPLGAEKRTLALGVAREFDTNLEAATAYANAWDDRFLLEAVGRPVAVQPDRRLRQLALASDWEILDESWPAPSAAASTRT